LLRELTAVLTPPEDPPDPPAPAELEAWFWPEMRYLIVVQGAMTTSSWSPPNMFAPLRDRTPTTRSATFFRRTSLPIGSSSPKSWFLMVCPMMQTLLPLRTSWSVNAAPSSIGHCRTSR